MFLKVILYIQHIKSLTIISKAITIVILVILLRIHTYTSVAPSHRADSVQQQQHTCADMRLSIIYT